MPQSYTENQTLYNSPVNTSSVNLPLNIYTPCNVSFGVWISGKSVITLNLVFISIGGADPSPGISGGLLIIIIIGGTAFIVLAIFFIRKCIAMRTKNCKRRNLATFQPGQTQTLSHNIQNNPTAMNQDGQILTVWPSMVNVQINRSETGRTNRREDIEERRGYTMPEIPDERSLEVNEELVCVVCLVARKEILFEPCNHVVTCPMCAYKILELQSKCPVCREHIISIAPVG